ncbi:hypothetical protein HNY73_007902 [Argiope bruennichi]|uniref:Uncharacterized protein n=1 Tax=Argiope bruennichi TaxID=94029 RepID=A0A8T0F6V5_ARGBR|nr:hypothetical protein HNY73_007902 [Argiope bruennichi]
MGAAFVDLESKTAAHDDIGAVPFKSKTDFLRRLVTVDEAWIHHYTETKQQSKQWTAKDESTPKKKKSKKCAICWKVYGISFLGR